MNKIYNALIGIILALCFILGAYYGRKLYEAQKTHQEQQVDLADIQMVKYGLFNVHHWKQEVMSVFEKKMDDFSLSPQVYTELEREISIYIRQMFREYITSGKLVDQFIDEALESGKINKMFATVIKQNVGPTLASLNLDAQIPSITKNLIAELKQREPEIRKFLVMDFRQMIAAEQASSIVDDRMTVAKKYGQKDPASTIAFLKAETMRSKPIMDDLSRKSYALLLIGLLGAFITFFFANRRMSLIFMVVGSIIMLILGIFMPMINIDARLEPFRISLLDSDIAFQEQTIFYQSKSILDVVSTMMNQSGLDMKIVAWMILAFSVLIPLLKLVLTLGTLFIDTLRNSSLVRGIVYHLGKWSMADVFVVALFMAYIGFYGLVRSQLALIERNETGFAVDTINYSHLSYGALFFTTYCIFSVVVGILSKRLHDEEVAIA